MDDVQAITDYCRGQGKSAHKAAEVFRRSRNMIARVLKRGVIRLRTESGRRRQPDVLLESYQDLIDDALLGRNGR